MAKLTLNISMSLDGFIAGPDQTLEEPLGQGGSGLHEWAFAALSWRERHGLPRRRGQHRLRRHRGIGRQYRGDRDGQADVQRRGRPLGKRSQC